MRQRNVAMAAMLFLMACGSDEPDTGSKGGGGAIDNKLASELDGKELTSLCTQGVQGQGVRDQGLYRSDDQAV